MTPRKFNSQPKKVKKQVILNQGVLLAGRKFSFFRVMLFQVEHFYVEVFYFKWSRQAVGFRSFQSTDKLKPYLQQIDVLKLMQQVFH